MADLFFRGLRIIGEIIAFGQSVRLGIKPQKYHVRVNKLLEHQGFHLSNGDKNVLGVDLLSGLRTSEHSTEHPQCEDSVSSDDAHLKRPVPDHEGAILLSVQDRQMPMLGSTNGGPTLGEGGRGTGMSCPLLRQDPGLLPYSIASGAKTLPGAQAATFPCIFNLFINIKLTIKVMNSSNQCILLS